MSILVRKEVRTVTLTYDDGETETFDPIVGFHRAVQRHDKGLPNPGPLMIHHEVQWSERAPEPDPE